LVIALILNILFESWPALARRLIRAKTVSARRVNTCEDSVFACGCQSGFFMGVNVDPYVKKNINR